MNRILSSLRSFASRGPTTKSLKRRLCEAAGQASFPELAARYRRSPDRFPAWILEVTGIATGVHQPRFRTVERIVGSIDHFSGDVAECGVWKGQTLFGIAHLLRLRGIAVPILGFDSFEGLPEPTVEDSSNGKFERITQEGVFGDTSYDDVLRRSQQLGFKNIELVQGYFEDTLKQYEDRRFSFVHLDVDLYRSYSTCLHFFYSRMVPNGVIVFDEYEWTPTFPGASLAINEFFQNKPECIQYFADLGLDARHFIVKASSSNLSVSAEGRARSANF